MQSLSNDIRTREASAEPVLDHAHSVCEQGKGGTPGERAICCLFEYVSQLGSRERTQISAYLAPKPILSFNSN